MRNFWVAIIGVLMIASFAGTSFATAPVVQDIPDFRLLTTAVVEDFDLNDYVTDYDNTPDSLLWTIQQTGFDGATPASLGADPNDNLLAIAGSATVTQGLVTFRATDASDEYSEDTSVVKVSTLMLVGPGLTQDRNLYPGDDAFPRTWVIEADTPITTGVISDLIAPVSASGADLSVSIADMDGNLLAGDNTASAQYGELSASLTGDGKLVLAAPAGSYPLTGMYQKAEAYRVGVKAKLTGGTGANWDGMELLVSQSRFPTNSDQATSELLEKFGNFEGVPTGDLPATQTLMRNLPSADSARWFTAVKTGTGTAAIVASAPTSVTTTWASSGQALKVTLPAEGDGVFIQSEWFTDIQPGETVTFSANVTTNAAADAVPSIVMFMGNFHMPSNYEGVVLQQGSNQLTDGAQVPVGGASGWRTIKATFTADKLGAAIADGSNPDVNFYERGYQCAISVAENANFSSSLPVEVYFDNIRVYRDKQDIDKALGATEIAVVKNGAQTAYFDGTFEAATTLTDLGWQVFAGAANGTAAINTSNNSHNGDSEGSNALEVYLQTASGRTSALAEFVMADINVNATQAGGVDNTGDGIYAVSLWFKTDAAAPKNVPGIMFGMSDLRFKNVPFSDTGFVAAPLAGGGWKKIVVSQAKYDIGSKQKIFAIVRADYPTPALRPYWGSYNSATEVPGALANAHVFIDDVKIHKIQDSAMYFDRSVFPVVD